MHLKTGPILLAFSFVACGGKAMDPGTSPAEAGAKPMQMKMGMGTPSAESQAVLAQTHGYETWPTFAENAAPMASKGHMNMYVVTYHNDVVANAVAAHTLPLPDGAVIVKQNKPTADAPPRNLTIMSKQSGTWYWLNATPDGKVITVNDMGLEGFDVPMCADCHDDASNNDYVFLHSFGE